MSSTEIDTFLSEYSWEYREKKNYIKEFLNILDDIQKLVEKERILCWILLWKKMVHKTYIMRTFLNSFSEPITFKRPSIIDISRHWFIASIQENVKRTRMGHEQKQKSPKNEVYNDSRSTPRCNAHVLVSHSEHKKLYFQKF